MHVRKMSWLCYLSYILQVFDSVCIKFVLLGGQAQGAEGTHMQADAFPGTSGTRNPIVIVKIFILLPVIVVLQAKPCKEGQCSLEGWFRHLHVPQTHKLHISASRGRYILGQCILHITPTPYVRHSKNVYPQIPWMELNHCAIGHTHKFFSQNRKN